MSRPTLLPHLRPLWRDRTSLQLGTDPARAVVLEFDDPATARLLDLLDGGRTEVAVLAEADALGVPPARARATLAVLRDAGAVVDAHALVPPGWPAAVRDRLYAEAVALAVAGHNAAADPSGGSARARGGPGGGRGSGVPGNGGPGDGGPGDGVPGNGGPGNGGQSGGRGGGPTPAARLRRRAAAQVLVAGVGPLVGPIAATLDAAGVGRVVTAPTERTAQLRSATLVVRVGSERRPAALVARAYARRRLAHLAVAVRDATVVVGPLVAPAGSPCLACLDLHRRDRDPAWPRLAEQLATRREPALACAAATVLAGAAYAAAEVLSQLDGARPRTRGATVEIGEPGQARRRSWPPHPGCDCRRPRRSTDHGAQLIR